MLVRRWCSARSMFMGKVVDGATCSSLNNTQHNKNSSSHRHQTTSKCNRRRVGSRSTHKVKTLNPNNSPLARCAGSRLNQRSTTHYTSRTSGAVKRAGPRRHTSTKRPAQFTNWTSRWVDTRRPYWPRKTTTAAYRKGQYGIRATTCHLRNRSRMHAPKVTPS